MKKLILLALFTSHATGTTPHLRSHRDRASIFLQEDPEPTAPLDSSESSSPITIQDGAASIDESNLTPLVNKTATEILTEGLEAQINQYAVGCDAANAVLFNATAAFNVTRDDILVAMEEVTLAVGDAHDATKELLKGNEDAAPEADVLGSLTQSQERAAHARSMRNKLNALKTVKMETEATTKEACDKLQGAKDELKAHLRQEYDAKRKVYGAVQSELKDAKRQLHSHLVQAKGDATEAQKAQEEGLLPGPIVTQKVLVVEKAVRAAKASKAFVTALKERVAETETEANDAHMAMLGVPMPEVQAKLDAADGAGSDDTPPGWSTPALTSLRQKYEEASANAEDARVLVQELRKELLDEDTNASSGGAAASGDASGAGGADAAADDASGPANAAASGPAAAAAEAFRFRTEIAALVSDLGGVAAGSDASGNSADSDASGASGGTGDEDGDASSGASGAADEDGEDASGSGASGSSGLSGGDASGPQNPGPASVVTHVIKQGDKTVVTTTTFHNQEDTPAAIWEKVKHLEEHKCDDCDGSTEEQGATGGDATGGDDATGGEATGGSEVLQATEAEEFNARLSSMENALMGAISQKRHSDEESARKMKESNDTIQKLQKELLDAKSAASSGAPDDPLAALKHIHSLASLTKSDGSGHSIASGNLTEHAAELKSVSTAQPEDVQTLTSIAKRLETMGQHEDAVAAEEEQTKGQEGESGSSSSSGPPQTESEQLALIAKRLASAIQGRSFGVTAQQEDGGSGSGSAAEEGDSSGPSGSTEEDQHALETVALKLTALVSGGDDASGGASGGSNEEEEPVNEITSAMEKLTSALGKEDAVAGADGDEKEGDVDAATVEAEELNDQQLEKRVKRLQTQLDVLRSSASGASGGSDGEKDEGEESEEGTESTEEGSTDESVEVPAEDGAAPAKGEDEEANSAEPEKPKPGDSVQPVTPEGSNTEGYKKAAMVDRNTIEQHLETQGQGEEDGIIDVPASTEGATAAGVPPPLPPSAAAKAASAGAESPDIVKSLGTSVPKGGDYSVTATTRR
jgi:hypothetical protein